MSDQSRLYVEELVPQDTAQHPAVLLVNRTSDQCLSAWPYVWPITTIRRGISSSRHCPITSRVTCKVYIWPMAIRVTLVNRASDQCLSVWPYVWPITTIRRGISSSRHCPIAFRVTCKVYIWPMVTIVTIASDQSGLHTRTVPQGSTQQHPS